jgi:hypothetical protein
VALSALPRSAIEGLWLSYNLMNDPWMLTADLLLELLNIDERLASAMSRPPDIKIAKAVVRLLGQPDIGDRETATASRLAGGGIGTSHRAPPSLSGGRSGSRSVGDPGVSQSPGFHGRNNSMSDPPPEEAMDAMQFLATVALLSTMDSIDKLNFVFNLYDFAEAGHLGRNAVVLLLRSCASGLGKCTLLNTTSALGLLVDPSSRPATRKQALGHHSNFTAPRGQALAAQTQADGTYFSSSDVVLPYPAQSQGRRVRHRAIQGVGRIGGSVSSAYAPGLEDGYGAADGDTSQVGETNFNVGITLDEWLGVSDPVDPSKRGPGSGAGGLLRGMGGAGGGGHEPKNASSSSISVSPTLPEIDDFAGKLCCPTQGRRRLILEDPSTHPDAAEDGEFADLHEEWGEEETPVPTPNVGVGRPPGNSQQRPDSDSSADDSDSYSGGSDSDDSKALLERMGIGASTGNSALDEAGVSLQDFLLYLLGHPVSSSWLRYYASVSPPRRRLPDGSTSLPERVAVLPPSDAQRTVSRILSQLRTGRAARIHGTAGLAIAVSVRVAVAPGSQDQALHTESSSTSRLVRHGGWGVIPDTHRIEGVGSRLLAPGEATPMSEVIDIHYTLNHAYVHLRTLTYSLMYTLT